MLTVYFSFILHSCFPNLCLYQKGSSLLFALRRHQNATEYFRIMRDFHSFSFDLPTSASVVRKSRIFWERLTHCKLENSWNNDNTDCSNQHYVPRFFLSKRHTCHIEYLEVKFSWIIIKRYSLFLFIFIFFGGGGSVVFDVNCIFASVFVKLTKLYFRSRLFFVFVTIYVSF